MADTTCFLNQGFDFIIDAIMGNSSIFNYMSWGTGTNVASVSNTSLQTIVTDSKYSAISNVTTLTTNDSFQATGAILSTVASTRNISEFGLGTSSNLILRSSFTGIPIQKGDTITFTVKIQFNQS